MTSSSAAPSRKAWTSAYDDRPAVTDGEPEQTARAIALIERLCGVPDAAAKWAVDVIHAQAAALAWVRDTTGRYPAPPTVAARIAAAATELRAGPPGQDPVEHLAQVAREALRAHQAAVV